MHLKSVLCGILLKLIFCIKIHFGSDNDILQVKYIKKLDFPYLVVFYATEKLIIHIHIAKRYLQQDVQGAEYNVAKTAG